MAVLLPDLQGLHASAGFQDSVAVALQDGADQVAEGRFVLDHQHGLRAAPHELCARRPLLNVWSRNCGRKVDTEGRSVAELALHPYPTVVLFHDRVNGCQSKTGSLADLLGGEEGFKNVA